MSSLFLSLLLLIAVSHSFLLAAPSHVNYGEADYDPSAIIAYFSEEASLSADTIDALSEGSFNDAQASLETLEAHIAPTRSTALGLSLAALALPLSSYYNASDTIAASLQQAMPLQEQAATGLSTLESAEDPFDHPDAFVSVRESLSLLEGFLEDIDASIELLASSGVDTTRLRNSFDAYEGVISSYEQRLLAFSEIDQSDFTFFVLHVYGPTSTQDETLSLKGMLYVDGRPVTGNPVELFENDITIGTVTTTEKGTFAEEYAIPSNLSHDVLSFHAVTSYNGVEYRTETVTVDLRIDTFLSLGKSYEITDDDVTITFQGRLRDAFWSGIADQSLTLVVDDETYQLVTEADGTYEHTVQMPFEEGMKVSAHSDYMPPEGSAYAPSRSSELVFYIRSTPPLFDLTVPGGFGATLRYLQDNLLYVILVIGAIVIASFAAVMVRRRKKPAMVDVPVEEDDRESVDSKEQTFEKELSLLEQLGGLREAVVAGYSAFIDYIERQGLITLDRRMTHRDIDRRLKQIPYTRDESPTITHTFELSRYSNRPIDHSRTSRFFAALRRVAARFGGDAR